MLFFRDLLSVVFGAHDIITQAEGNPTRFFIDELILVSTTELLAITALASLAVADLMGRQGRVPSQNIELSPPPLANLGSVTELPLFYDQEISR